MDWPVPDKPAQAHSERLVAHLRSRIDAAGGRLGFADWLNETLYAPGLGYYSAGAAKLGAAGDFVTAPEVSPLFGRCLASQVAELLHRSGGDTVIEAGGGTGALAAEVIPGCGPARYRLVEVSADLRQRQREALEGLDCTIDWADGPAALDPVDGVILGNEVIDALPFERFRIHRGRVESLGVGWSGDNFEVVPEAAGAELVAAVRRVEGSLGNALPDGFVSEIRPQLPAFIAGWCRALRRGAMIWVDYGCSRAELYAAERSSGTMMCHYRHRAHADPFVYPGLQDITAWVDFTALAEAGVDNGLALAGYSTQAHFLLGCGIEQRFDEMRRETAGDADTLALSEQLRRLMLPGEMGERFRVMVLTRGIDEPLIGFSFRDLAASL